jgi:L-threonylcarbamoyladenylate synthase
MGMKTKVLARKQIKIAANLIKQSKLVAFPTETVYGLGANALNKKAVEKIYKAKGRPFADPLIVHCSNLKMAKGIAEFTPEAILLAKKFWPGPLTLILKKKEIVPDIVTARTNTVGVRIPQHPVALALIKSAGVPIAAPSANLFSRTSPTDHLHVIEDLDGKIDAVIEGGQSKIGVESTVLDLTGSNPKILRPGGVTYESLIKVLKNTEDYTGAMNRKSPGNYKYHYSPKAQVVLVKDLQELKREIQIHNKKKIGIFIFSEWAKEKYRQNVEIFFWGSKKDKDKLANRLFTGLRHLDSKKVQVIYCPLPDEKGIGKAIVNRLNKASGI